LFKANVPGDVLHLGLQTVIIGNIYYIHLSLMSISCG